MSPSTIQTLVRASALWNVLLAAAALQTGVAALRQKEQATAYFNLMTCAFLAFTAAALFLAARSLETRASIVFWEGFLRIGAAVILLTIGRTVLGDGKACFLAMTDLAWAVVYQAGLMHAFGKTYWQLLCDL
jgi:hypothetical protein